MGWYLNNYLSIDINLPKTYTYVVDTLPFLKMDITWDHFKYDQVYLDMNTV